MEKQLTPQELFDKLEGLYNQTENNYGAGYADATAHIGGLIAGMYTPELVADVHKDTLDPEGEDYTESYAEGYNAQWNRLTLLTSSALVKADGYGTE